MNVVLSIRRFVSWRAVVAAWLAVSTVANATSIYFPKFSKPVLKEERLVFTSPDSKRLLCITVDGEKLWEKSHAYPVDLIAGRDSEPLLQTGKVVSVIYLRT